MFFIRKSNIIVLLLCLCLIATSVGERVVSVNTTDSESISQLQTQINIPSHIALEDTHAIIVSASRYWFNYRHSSNAFAIYHVLRRLGLTDDRIILMIADDHSCSPKNVFPGKIFNSEEEKVLSVMPDDVEIDYSGLEVTPVNLLRTISGRYWRNTPRRKRLLSGRTSNLLIYLTGHGGDGFLKFHDKDELSYADFGASLSDAYQMGRFGRAFVLADTCQAATISDHLSIQLEDLFLDRVSNPTTTSLEPTKEIPSWISALPVPLADVIRERLPRRFLDIIGASELFVRRVLRRLRDSREESAHLDVLDWEGYHVPGAFVLATSERGLSSYAYGHDPLVGLALADGFTRAFHDAVVNSFDLRSRAPYFPSTASRGLDPPLVTSRNSRFGISPSNFLDWSKLSSSLVVGQWDVPYTPSSNSYQSSKADLSALLSDSEGTIDKIHTTPKSRVDLIKQRIRSTQSSLMGAQSQHSGRALELRRFIDSAKILNGVSGGTIDKSPFTLRSLCATYLHLLNSGEEIILPDLETIEELCKLRESEKLRTDIDLAWTDSHLCLYFSTVFAHRGSQASLIPNPNLQIVKNILFPAASINSQSSLRQKGHIDIPDYAKLENISALAFAQLVDERASAENEPMWRYFSYASSVEII